IGVSRFGFVDSPPTKSAPSNPPYAYTSNNIVSNQVFADTAGIASGMRNSGRVAIAQHPANTNASRNPTFTAVKKLLKFFPVFTPKQLKSARCPISKKRTRNFPGPLSSPGKNLALYVHTRFAAAAGAAIRVNQVIHATSNPANRPSASRAYK